MATGYLGTNYTQDQINSVPLLADYVNSLLVGSQGDDTFTKVKHAQLAINQGMTNPVSFVENQLSTQVANYVVDETLGLGQPQVRLSAIKSAEQYLASNGVSSDQINSQIKAGETSAQNSINTENAMLKDSGGGSGGFFNSLTDALSNPTTLLEIAAAASIPGAAEALAPSIAAGLGVSTATATAIAAGSLSAATQVAAGVPVQTAIQNAAVGSIVSTGTNEAANAIISNNPGSSVASVLSTPVPGAAAGSLSPVVSAVSQGLASGADAALTGQNVAQAIEKGAAIGGISSAAAQGVSSVNSPGAMAGTGLGGAPNVTQPTDTTPPAPTVVNPMTETPVSYGPNSTSLTTPLISTAPTELANYNLLQQPAEMTPGGEVLPPSTYNVANPLTGGDSTQGNLVSRLNSSGEPMIPTEGGLGIIGDPNVVLPASFAAYATYPSQMRAGSDGTLIPAYQNAADTITPGGLSQYNLSGSPQETVTAEPQTTPGLSLDAQNALQSIFGYGLGLIGPKGSGLGAIGTNATGTSAGTTGTTSSTTGGSPGGTELDPSTGKAPELAWGDKYTSLKEGLNL